ncbi:MAG: bifunctional enoyl-CoA hydratase/phosphate acetyltransferase [Calditrichales bacterium]|nr:MAG: bifunctional enoyl-CoA hydratase/phosphate acetyltransferase [Calditrichales bacterium]
MQNFEQIINQVKKESKRTVAVAMAEDRDVLIALEKARAKGLTHAILTGNKSKILAVLKEINATPENYEIIDSESEQAAVTAAVSLVRKGQAQVVMKGLCSTSVFLKGILDKENGLRSGNVISHLAIFESPNYHKLFMMSDAAMNIAPDLTEKIYILENAINTALRLGYECPKVAVISAVEKVNATGIPSSADAAIIAKMGDRGQIKSAIIDGPLAVDNALSKQACKVKGLNSPVGGDADICLVPNIETGNAFYKLMTIMGNAKVAGIVVGAAAPVVLTSRADSEESKYLSIITALCAS